MEMRVGRRRRKKEKRTKAGTFEINNCCGEKLLFCGEQVLVLESDVNGNRFTPTGPP